MTPPVIGPYGCQAPGPGLLECSGRAAHPGLHGSGDVRWTDADAARYLEAENAENAPQEPPSGPLQVFRGVVHTVGRSTFRGVVTLLDGWVHVELVSSSVRSDDRPELRDGVSAVLIPVHEVGAIDVAREQADRV